MIEVFFGLESYEEDEGLTWSLLLREESSKLLKEDFDFWKDFCYSISSWL